MGRKTDKEKIQDDKIVERLSALQSSIDELSACVYSMSKKITYLHGMLKNLAANKPWLFKDSKIREKLSSQQLMALDKLKYEESKIKEPDENVSDSQYNEDSETSN